MTLLEQAVATTVAAIALSAAVYTIDAQALATAARSAYTVVSEKGVESSFSGYYSRFGSVPTFDDLVRTGYIDSDVDRATVDAALAPLAARLEAGR